VSKIAKRSSGFGALVASLLLVSVARQDLAMA
jgi:hypothetical protein